MQRKQVAESSRPRQTARDTESLALDSIPGDYVESKASELFRATLPCTARFNSRMILTRRVHTDHFRLNPPVRGDVRDEPGMSDSRCRRVSRFAPGK